MDTIGYPAEQYARVIGCSLELAKLIVQVREALRPIPTKVWSAYMVHHKLPSQWKDWNPHQLAHALAWTKRFCSNPLLEAFREPT